MKTISLNGKWKCCPDYENQGLRQEWYSSEIYKRQLENLMDIEIPNSFNLLEGFEVYEGIFWHFTEFTLDPSDLDKDHDYIIQLGGSNYITRVWLNGQFAGMHEGGFTPFRLKVNQKIKPQKNFLVVQTDSTRRKGQIPDYTFDWLNYGGIFRDVDLLILNNSRVEDVVIKTHLKSRSEAYIEVQYRILGILSFNWQVIGQDGQAILFEGNISESSSKGGFSITFKNPQLWSPESPNLYFLKIISSNKESPGEVLFETHFGIREIEVRGRYVYLNKKRLYFKGVSLHEEYMPYGRTIPYEKREEDVRNMKSLGLNALRTAHYSHDKALIEVADKLGLLILEEIPVYWQCDYKSNDAFKVAAKMMRELIKRDINSPSVVWWSVGNEVPVEKRECSIFFKRMMDWVRRFDDTRIVTFVVNKMVCDLTKRHADVGAINLYFGWYYGSPRMVSTIVSLVHTPIHNKPLFYTEFGAGAKYGFHAPWEEQAKFSEEKQLYVLDYTIRTLNSIDYVAGWFIWIYRDFRSFLRQNEYQQGYNRKGIVSGEKNEKKLIYHRLPQIINQPRKVKQSRLFSTLMWCILFPLAYLLTYFIDTVLTSGQKKRIDAGLQQEKERLSQIS